MSAPDPIPTTPLPALHILDEDDTLATCREITICDDRDGDVAEIWIDEYALVNTTRAQAIELGRLLVAAPAMVEALQDLIVICERSFAPSHAALSMGSSGWVEGRQLRTAVDAARRALSLARGAPDV